MALGRPLSPLTLVPAERQRLLEWTRKTAQALALRSRIALRRGVEQHRGGSPRAGYAGHSRQVAAAFCPSPPRWTAR
jgi:hypothetical protein